MEKKLQYSVNDFFDLFIQELKVSPNLHYYYKFNKTGHKFNFRKAYFIQRLQYIINNIHDNDIIWDFGCGYGTTAIFLALNNYSVTGTTLEHYYKDIPNRLNYWKQYGDLSNLEINYENIFDSKFENDSFNTIIVQDTLHHLEPMNEALSILSNTLKPNGQIVVIEENGSNIIQNSKLFIYRGNKRIIKSYDSFLKKEILFGNENIRSYDLWEKEFEAQGLKIEKNSLQYIRFLPPFFFKNKAVDDLIKKEQSISKKSKLLRKYFFFGINFIAKK